MSTEQRAMPAGLQGLFDYLASSPDARSVRQHQVFVQGYLMGLLHGNAINDLEQREFEQQLAKAVDARLAELPHGPRDWLC